MKKRLFKICLVFILSALMLCCFTLASCGYKSEYAKNVERIFETEYFRCINYEGEDTVTILELTDLGKEQEVLVIPSEINGMRVECIGGRIKGEKNQTHWFEGIEQYGLISNNLTKLYLNNNGSDWASYSVHNLPNAEVLIMPNDKQEYPRLYEFIRNYINCKGVILEKSLVDLEWLNEVIDNAEERITYANILFYYNAETEAPLYWFDYIVSGSVYAMPDKPTKPGYTFVGWYYESDCVNKWDEEFELAEGQGELNLYAKWI